jgi:hypothetical protein
MSDTADIMSKWFHMPPDIKERHCSFTIEYGSGESVDAANVNSKLLVQKPPDTDTDTAEPEPELESTSDLDDHIQLLGWNQSNHECMLFNNKAHSVQFLSRDANKMKDSMHPTLLRQLEQNNIDVGASLEELNSRFVDILGMLTGVQRTREEAGQLMRGDYAITGDNLLKMLAIFVRVRCGLPVVLSGECGCGERTSVPHSISTLLPVRYTCM